MIRIVVAGTMKRRASPRCPRADPSNRATENPIRAPHNSPRAGQVRARRTTRVYEVPNLANAICCNLCLRSNTATMFGSNGVHAAGRGLAGGSKSGFPLQELAAARTTFEAALKIEAKAPSHGSPKFSNAICRRREIARSENSCACYACIWIRFRASVRVRKSHLRCRDDESASGHRKAGHAGKLRWHGCSVRQLCRL